MRLKRATLALAIVVLLAALAACDGQPAGPEPTQISEPGTTPAPATVEPGATPPATSAPAGETATPAPTRRSRTYLSYESEANGFSIDYPEEWEVTEREAMPGTTTFVAPLQGEGDTFRENVTIVVQSVPADATTLDEFTELALAQGQEVIPRFQVRESRPATLGGNPAQQVVYTGVQGDRELRWLQLWTLTGDQVYILTYTAEEFEFTAFRSVVQQMITSMEIR